MKNTRNRKILAYALIGLILAALFWLPSKEENKVEVDVELYSENEGQREWTPGLSLPAGTYNMGVVIANNDSGVINEVEFWTTDQGVVYAGQIDAADYSTWFTVTLENPSNILYVRTIDSEDGSITVQQIVAESMSGSIYHDAAFFIVLFVIVYILFGLYLFSDKAVTSRTYGYAAVLGAVILSSCFLFKPYLTVGHDIRFHLYRIESIKDALLAGQFPVRLHPTFNNGYGYATATVYPELFLYIPAVLRILGVSIPTAYQFFLFLINLATAWIMYYSVRSVTKSNFASVTASVAYTLFPYRLVCMYERAAVGEALGLCFIPLVIAGIYHVFLGNQKKWYLIVLGAVAVFQSHMLSTILTAVIAVALGIIYLPRLFKDRRWLSLLKAIGLTVLLSMWYLIPFADFYRMTLRLKTVPTYSYAENAVFLPELFNVFADSTGMSYDLKYGMRGEMTMTLGLVVSLCAVICFAVFFIQKKARKGFPLTLFVLSMLAVLSTTTWFPWKQLENISIVSKVTSMLQFPWRLLGYAGVLILFAGAMLLAEYGSNWKRNIRIIALSGVFFLSAWSAVQYNAVMADGDVFLAKGEAPDANGSAGSHQEYLLEGTDTARLVSDQYRVSNLNTTIVSTDKFATNIDIVYRNDAADAWLEVPLLWYPGYRAVDENGNELSLACGDGNILRVLLPDYTEGEIHITFEERRLYWIGDAVTLASILGIAAVQGKKYVGNGKKKYCEIKG